MFHLGYGGDPFDSRRGCEIEPCSTGPCGTNAECTSNRRTAICKVEHDIELPNIFNACVYYGVYIFDHFCVHFFDVSFVF